MDFKLPSFPDWDKYEDVSYNGSFWNDNDLNSLNSTIIKTALNLKAINKELTKYERQKVLGQIIYNHKYREVLLNAQGKTESQKKLIAEIECEEESSKLAYLDEIIRELTRISNSLRIDLDVLKTIGHNIRQELKL